MNKLAACTHPFRRTEYVDCGAYIAVMIYCAVCGAFITQINKYKDEAEDLARPTAWNETDD